MTLEELIADHEALKKRVATLETMQRIQMQGVHERFAIEGAVKDADSERDVVILALAATARVILAAVPETSRGHMLAILNDANPPVADVVTAFVAQVEAKDREQFDQAIEFAREHKITWKELGIV